METNSKKLWRATSRFIWLWERTDNGIFSSGTVESYYVDNGPCNFSTLNFDYSENDNQLIFSVDGEGINGGAYVLTSIIEVLNETTLRYRFISDNEEGTYPESEQDTETYIRLQ